MFDYYREPAEAAAGVKRVFDLIGNGALTVTIGQTYPLRDAAQAHRDLEARRTTGSMCWCHRKGNGAAGED